MKQQSVDRVLNMRCDRRSVMKGVAVAAFATPFATKSYLVVDAQDKHLEIAYLTPGLNLPFWKYLSDGIKQAAAASGADVSVTDYDSRNDAATQLQNAQDAITRGVDAIIISPTDSSTAPAVLELAAESNVPVIIADIGTDSGEYVSFVISSNEQGAYEAGQVLIKDMKAAGWDGADVVMITISQARINGQNRTKGFTRAVEEGGSKVVQYLESKDYTRAEAQQQALDLLTANPGARGFFTQHDEATLGTWTAIENSDKQNDIILVGFDGSPESVDLIREGKLKAASMQQPVLMGRMAFDVTLRHLNGEEVEKETSVPTILVTPDNLKDVEATLADTVFPVEGGTPATS